MGFSSLLGNDRLKNNLTAAVNSGKTAHFYLITGAPGSGRKTLARLLAAALQCEGADRPCLACNICRKAMANTHPDIITVDDTEHKNLPVKLIRETCSDLYIRPNEGKKKIYIIPRAQDMRVEAQNAFLKNLEEPPPYGVFILIADNPEKLLPTIRSRSVTLQMTALPQDILLPALKARLPGKDAALLQAAADRSAGFLGQALELAEGNSNLSQETQQFFEAFLSKSTLDLTTTLVPMERYKRDRLIPILEEWENLLQQALVSRSGGKALLPQAKTLGETRDPKDILQALRNVKKCIEYANGNVSCAAICGYLAWALR